MRLFYWILFVFLVGCTPRVNTADLAANMSQQEVVQMLGQPESSGMNGGISYLYFRVHDHAFGRDVNHYVFAFRDNKLVSFEPLPAKLQEMGPIDRALNSRRGRVNTGDSYVADPDAYGPGLHADQYGRPVVVVPQ